jgi:hypothetical protein
MLIGPFGSEHVPHGDGPSIWTSDIYVCDRRRESIDLHVRLSATAVDGEQYSADAQFNELRVDCRTSSFMISLTSVLQVNRYVVVFVGTLE